METTNSLKRQATWAQKYLDSILNEKFVLKTVYWKSPALFWKKVQKLVDTLNLIHSNPYLEAVFAARQEAIIRKYWIGERYPKKYQNKENNSFWIAQTAEQKKEGARLLREVKKWKATKERFTRHTHNFSLHFLAEADYMSKYNRSQDFLKLEVTISNLAKIYAFVHFKMILNRSHSHIHNALTSRHEYNKTEQLLEQFAKVEDGIKYKQDVQRIICSVFDTLVLKYGYNPIILMG